MSHDNDRTGQSSYHTCSFNTAGDCSCDRKMKLPESSTTASQPGDPGYVPIAARVDPTGPVNLGSPVGPGFVVYERSEGGERLRGYSRKMALDSVGKGWHGLLNATFDRIEADIKYNGGRFLGGLVLTQVKEKFGTLRVYWYTMNGDEGYAEGFVSAMETASAHICEDCGKPGTVRSRSWIRTLCDECHAPKTVQEQREDA